MKPLLILNDCHIGVKRSAGTTPASALALRRYLLDSFRSLLPDDKDVLVLGDLFDDFVVDQADFWETFLILSEWLRKGNHLTLTRGNHDWSPRANAKSSFDLLADLLSHVYDNVTVVRDGLTDLGNGILVIPHMPNQDLFDLELDKAEASTGLYLLTHCNMMPPACHGRQDHSLTIDEDRAIRLSKKFILLNAHEHQHIDYDLGKGIYCLGNQTPSSISDCLSKGRHQQDGCKYAMVVQPDMGRSLIPTWKSGDDFVRKDWRDLDDVSEGFRFIRVEGRASAEEASLVVDAIARLRARHSAYVISNAVQVDGQEGVEEAAESTYAAIKVFDVMGALLNELEEDERKVIKEVMQ